MISYLLGTYLFMESWFVCVERIFLRNYFVYWVLCFYFIYVIVINIFGWLLLIFLGGVIDRVVVVG